MRLVPLLVAALLAGCSRRSAPSAGVCFPVPRTPYERIALARYIADGAYLRRGGRVLIESGISASGNVEVQVYTSEHAPNRIGSDHDPQWGFDGTYVFDGKSYRIKTVYGGT